MCRACGSNCDQRLPLTPEGEAVYDALFTGEHRVLAWSESDDCQMNELMRDVAEVAARAALEARP